MIFCISSCTRANHLIFGWSHTEINRPCVPCTNHDLSQPHHCTHQTSAPWCGESFSLVWWNGLWIKRVCSLGYSIGLPRAPQVLWLLLSGTLTRTSSEFLKEIHVVSLEELLWLQFPASSRFLSRWLRDHPCSSGCVESSCCFLS